MILVLFALVIFCCLWIAKACDPFEDAVDYLGRNFSDGIKGATFDAVGSSMPEFLITFIFMFFFFNQAGFESGLATTAGSAVFNSMLIPAACIFMAYFFLKKTVSVSKKSLYRDGFFLLLIEAVLIWSLSPDLSGKVILSWKTGAGLMSIYLAYIGYIYYQHNKSFQKAVVMAAIGEVELKAGKPLPKLSSQWFGDFCIFEYKRMLCGQGEFTTARAWAALSLSITHLSLACYLLSHCTIKIAEYFGMAPFFVAIVVAAAATSVPDTIISMKETMKGNDDDAMSNVLGSNIFDIGIALGFNLFLFTLINGSITISGASTGIQSLRILLFGLTALVIVLLSQKKVGVKTATILAAGYLFYAVFSWCSGLPEPPQWTVEINNVLNNVSGLK